MSKYLLSIIIPTKDRYQYLKESIKSIVEIKSEKIEIIIQDNTKDNSEIQTYIRRLNWQHIKYFHNRAPFTITENSEEAINNSSGEYVCFIGDDDSITEIIVSVVELLKENSIESCNVNMVGYYWPDVNNKNYYLSFDKRKVKVFKINTKKIFEKYLKMGMQEMLMLPRLYHGIISRKILNEIKKISGSYFPGPSPDMANAAVASLILKWHLFIRLPVIISGTSYKSAAGKGVRGDHKGNLSSMSHLAADIEKKWNPKIPKVWLMNTIWPETCLKALGKANAFEYMKRFNYYPIYSRVWIKYKEYRPLVKKQLVSKLDYLMTISFGLIDVTRWIFKKASKKIREWLHLEYIGGEKISLEDVCQIANNHNGKRDNVEIIRRIISKKYS
jgi:glycosyltransferase involved in cell wall biosynthesis